MLKKFLCITLAIITAMSVSVAAATDTDTTTVVDFSLLKALGFFEGVDSNGCDKLITRGEFAVEAARLTGYNGDDAVAYLRDAGVISGDADGNIRTDDVISGNEALKILVSSLGYDLFAQKSGGYPSGYYAVAGELGIGGFIKGGEGLTYNGAAQLIADAGRAPVADVSFTGGALSVKMGQEKTAFYHYHKILTLEGVVIANGYTSFDGTGGVKGTIRIGDTEIADENGVGTDFLGMNVVAYCRDNSDGTHSLKWITGKNNETITVRDTQIADIDGNVRSFTVWYRDDNGKLRHITAEDYYPVFNGGYDTLFMPEDLLEINGSVSFTDNDRDGKYELADIKSHRTIVFEAMSADGEKILDYYGRHFILPNDEMYRITDADGRELSVSDLKKGMLLSVRESRDGRYATIYASERTARGTVTSLKTTDDGCEVTLSEDRVFILSSEYEKLVNDKKTDIHTGQHIELMFDIEGRIAEVVLIDGGYWKYGFVIKCIQDDSSAEPAVRLKLFTEDNAFLIYPLREKTIVDGVARDLSNVCTYIKNPEKNKIEGQIIRFLTNKGAITKIDTLNPDSDVDSLTRMTELDDMAVYCDPEAQVLFDGYNTLAAGNSKTVVMGVPNHSDLYNEQNCFSIGKISGLGDGSGFNGAGGLKLEVYDIDENNIASLVVRYQGLSNINIIQPVTPYLIFTDAETQIDANGEIRQYVSGIEASTGKTYSAYVREGLELPQLEKGDLIRYRIKNKEFANFKKDIADRFDISGDMVRVSEGNSYTITSSVPSKAKNTYRAALNIYQGKIYFADSENFALSANGTDKTIFAITDTTPVYVCRQSEKNHTEAVKAEELVLYTADTCPDAAVCVIQRQSVVDFIMIYIP